MFSDVLLLLLGLTSVLGALPPQPKPGTCPRPLDYYPCDPNPQDSCTSDWDCTGTRKCCRYQCRMQCVLPTGAKTNPCPYNTYDPTSDCVDKKYTNQCSNDNQCPGTDRCCCSRCARKCTPTIPVHPGHCPPLPAACSIPVDPPKCQNDGPCKPNEKCCNMCGMKCVVPQKDNPGLCPDANSLFVPCNTCYPDKCANDQECGSDQKCCDYGCIKECVKPLQERGAHAHTIRPHTPITASPQSQAYLHQRHAAAQLPQATKPYRCLFDPLKEGSKSSGNDSSQ